jgi:hypothetical protein
MPYPTSPNSRNIPSIRKTPKMHVKQSKRYESDAKKELNRILSECRKVKGNSHGELSEDMEGIRVDLGIQVLKAKMH